MKTKAKARMKLDEFLELRNFNELKQIKVKITTPKSIKLYSCDMCDYESTRASNLQVHRRIHSKVQERCNTFFCDICKKYILGKEKMLLHNAEHGLENLECDLCGQHFLVESALADHVASHVRQHLETFECKKGYECEEKECAVCEEKFLYFYRCESNWQEGFICDVCTKSDYKKRMKAAKKSYHCMICNCTFPNKNVMKRHMMFHKLEMEFKCLLCNAVLNNEYQFYFHKKSHEENWEKIEAEDVGGYIKKEILEEIECEEIIITNEEEISNDNFCNAETVCDLQNNNDEDKYEIEPKDVYVNIDRYIKQEKLDEIECEETTITHLEEL